MNPWIKYTNEADITSFEQNRLEMFALRVYKGSSNIILEGPDVLLSYLFSDIEQIIQVPLTSI